MYTNCGQARAYGSRDICAEWACTATVGLVYTTVAIATRHGAGRAQRGASMTRVKIVSGYVPLPKNPRPLEDYAASGARINSLRAPKAVFTQSLESCWLYKFLQTTGPVTHSQGKWPLKNTLDYMIVQHQKFEWIACAAGDDTGNADVFVWIDYGVFCQGPAITEQIIESF